MQASATAELSPSAFKVPLRGGDVPGGGGRRRKAPSGPDAPVIRTNDDAASSKLSAVQLGYYQDNFLSYFVQGTQRRSPIINRGYYTRVVAMHHILKQFLRATPSAASSMPNKQVICLGAGFDTTYFQKKRGGLIGDNVTYYELDFPEVVANKAAVIRKYSALREVVGLPVEEAETEKGSQSEIHTTSYHLMGADLRNVEKLDEAMVAAGIDFSKPTLFISECVLIYVKPEDSTKLLQWASRFKSSVFLIYEQILPHDSFGRVMLRNLEDRDIRLLGISDYPDIPSQRQRFLSLGWEQVEALDMNEISKLCIPPSEQARISRVEFLDEHEELTLLQAHYCVACATKEDPQLHQGIWRGLGFAASSAATNKNSHATLPLVSGD
ncbi:Leucine carboxyl methyltransferase 1 [Balamuthia mandrillaris]